MKNAMVAISTALAKRKGVVNPFAPDGESARLKTTMMKLADKHPTLGAKAEEPVTPMEIAQVPSETAPETAGDGETSPETPIETTPDTDIPPEMAGDAAGTPMAASEGNAGASMPPETMDAPEAAKAANLKKAGKSGKKGGAK